jgi:hypothetical protein
MRIFDLMVLAWSRGRRGARAVGPARLLVMVGLVLLAPRAHAQPAPDRKPGDAQIDRKPAGGDALDRIVVGIYAPTVEFATSAQRLAYVRALAAAIGRATGLEVEAQSYANLGALVKAGVDFAIVDAPCVALQPSWRVLATATVGGGTSRAWALFASVDRAALRGKKLAFVATGCNDAGFIDHAMLDSEADAGFFGARVGKQDLTAAIAEVASYRTAQAVFAPVASVRGLTRMFDAGMVPNPAFVQLASKLGAAITDRVAAAVIGYGGGAAITGWTRAERDAYAAFAGRMSRSTKRGVFAAPEPLRIDGKDLVAEPPSLRDVAVIPIRQLFVRAPNARLE